MPRENLWKNLLHLVIRGMLLPNSAIAPRLPRWTSDLLLKALFTESMLFDMKSLLKVINRYYKVLELGQTILSSPSEIADTNNRRPTTALAAGPTRLWHRSLLFLVTRHGDRILLDNHGNRPLDLKIWKEKWSQFINTNCHISRPSC